MVQVKFYKLSFYDNTERHRSALTDNLRCSISLVNDLSSLDEFDEFIEVIKSVKKEYESYVSSVDKISNGHLM